MNTYNIYNQRLLTKEENTLLDMLREKVLSIRLDTKDGKGKLVIETSEPEEARKVAKVIYDVVEPAVCAELRVLDRNAQEQQGFEWLSEDNWSLPINDYNEALIARRISCEKTLKKLHDAAEETTGYQWDGYSEQF